MKHPDIIEAAVIGVPDERWGETPKAFVTTKPQSTVAGQDIIQWARRRPELSGFMVPRDVQIVPELPKTSTGKIQKKTLRDAEKQRQSRPVKL